MKKNKMEIIKYINNLKGYQGYVQFSDTKIRDCDIFKEFQDIKLTLTNGFIYEAHFYNGNDSISIKQINDNFYINEEFNVNIDDIQIYISDITDCPSIKMAQIWEEKLDELCENMKVLSLKKVIFVGFNGISNKVKQKKKITINTREEKYSQEQKEILLNHFLNIFKDEYIDSVLENKNEI